MGFSSDYIPYVGEVPKKPGQLVMAGFSGHGMPLILLSAKAIADMVKEGKSFEQTGVPSVFKVTKERLDSTVNSIIEDHDRSYPKSKL